jgi:hypothetical protein
LTLVLTINGPETLWVLADRRLSFNGRATRDDAHKIASIETNDGVAFLAYAGLGATAAGTQPSDWMSAVLRGRHLPLEAALQVLAEAMKAQLPQHLTKVSGTSGPAHIVLAPAFLNGEPRLYSIDLALDATRKRQFFRHTKWIMGSSSRCPV